MKKLVLILMTCTLLDCSETDGGKSPDTVNPVVNDGNLSLPAGFAATVFADMLGKARHIVVANNGTVYINLESLKDGYGLVGLRDSDQDGKADETDYFGEVAGTGIGIYENYLYHSSNSEIYRVKLPEDGIVPSMQHELVIGGLLDKRQHAAKSFTFDDQGNIYVNIGAPANACMEQGRTKGSPGMDPCPLLENSGGIWRFPANQTGQDQMRNGHRYSTGIRNSVAIGYNEFSSHVYVVQHGRDQLHQLFPEYYSAEESAELPAEEFLMLEEGADFGWPYCYYDQINKRKVLAPEYGGNGDEVGRCADKKDPIMAFPGHWAPNALLFYTGGMFPSKYRNGAFIAFHGSWNRAPEQKGYFVVFVPFEGSMPSGDYEVFADGFAGIDHIESPSDAKYRPTGLAQGPDGSLYVTDDNVGRVWKITYTGGN